jgi:hypothetical protein
VSNAEQAARPAGASLQFGLPLEDNKFDWADFLRYHKKS